MSVVDRAVTMERAVQTLMRYALYVRVSTEDQADAKTIDAQIDFLTRHCELHELPIAGIYRDDGVSGTLPLRDRPDGRRLLADAEDGAFQVVLVFKLDRLARKLRVLLVAHDELEAVGVAMQSVTEPYETTTPVGRLVFQLLGSLAEFDRATTLDRLSRGRDRVAKVGQYTGGPIPFGYDLDADRRLVPSARLVPEVGMTEPELVRDIFRRVADREITMNAECKRLTALGVRRVQRYAPNRSKARAAVEIERTAIWGLSSLGGMLHNATYKGGGRVESKHGEVTRPAPAIVDSETWERVQRVLAENRKTSSRGEDFAYLLRGLVTCGNCGLTFVGGPNAGVPKYRCSSNAGRAARHATRCPARRVDARLLEAIVWDELRAFASDPTPYLAEAQASLRARLADTEGLEAERRTLTKSLAGRQAERDRVLLLFRKGRISEAKADADLDEIDAETARDRERLDALRTRAEMAAASEAQLAGLGPLLAAVRSEAEAIEREGDRARMRALIERLVPGIVVRTEVLGMSPGGRRRTRAEVVLTLAFGVEKAAVSVTDCRDAMCRPTVTLRMTRPLARPA